MGSDLEISSDGDLPNLNFQGPRLEVGAGKPSVSTDIQKPDIDVKIDGKEPSMDNLIPTADLSMQKPSIGGETPDIGVSLEGKPADLNIDASFPKVQVPKLSLETEEKNLQILIGIWQKRKEKE